MNPTNPPNYPKNFLWGVATAAYQIEGHLNQPNTPQNNWAPWEKKRNCTPTKTGCNFWYRWRDDIQLAQKLHCNAFRLSLEWARLQPQPHAPIHQPTLHHYAQIIAYIHQLQMLPVLTLHHFTHPLWLGLDIWTSNKGPTAFQHYLQQLIPQLNYTLLHTFQLPPISFYVTLNEPNILAIMTHLLGIFPHKKRGIQPFFQAYLHLLQTHIQTYYLIHNIYQQHQWPTPTITTNLWNCSLYHLDKFALDLLNSPFTQPKQLQPYLKFQQKQWKKHIAHIYHQPQRTFLNHTLEKILAALTPYHPFLKLVQQRGTQPTLDCIAIDYYDPFLAHYLLSPPHLLRAQPWTWRDASPQLLPFLQAYLQGHPNKKLYILENGICYQAHPNLPASRPDQLTKPQQLQNIFQQLDLCLQQNIPLSGYLHWSLIDNYEWGSFTPRFGLHGIHYQQQQTRLPTDAAGHPSPQIYAKLIQQRKNSHTKKE